MSKFEDHLWREVARQYGPDVERAGRPRARQTRLQPRVLVGSSILGLAGVGATVALVLSAASTSPAFAVTRNHDGTITVLVKRSSGIAGANAKLHQLGIRAIVLLRAPVRCTDLPITQEGAPAPRGNFIAPGGNLIAPRGNLTGAHWTIDRKVPAGQILALTPAPAPSLTPAPGPGGNSGTAGNSGTTTSGGSQVPAPSGNTGTTTSGGSQVPAPSGNTLTTTSGRSQVPAPSGNRAAAGQVWTCHVQVQRTPSPGAGNSGNSGNSGNR